MRLKGFLSGLWKLCVAVVVLFIILFFSDREGVSAPSVIESTLFAMTPLALAALGESVNELAGMCNIGLEGIFLLTATLGVYGAEQFNNGWAGLLFGMFIGGLVGLAFALISIYGRADQIVLGMGINIFAAGFVPYFLMAEWAFPGIHIPPSNVLVRPLYTKWIRVSQITIFAIILGFVLWYIENKTPLGLRIKAAGEAPVALDVAGVSIEKIRIACAVFGGAMTGLGGAFMSLAWFGGVVKEISAGRGFIALAVLVAAGLEPLLILAFAFLFGFAEGFAYSAAVTPTLKRVVPYHIIFMIPYIVTLVAVAVFIGRAKFPSELAKPYTRE